MSEIITDSDSNYAFDIVKKICSEVGPGVPGSPQEQKRADIIKKELESHLGTDNVAVEEFTLSVAMGRFLVKNPSCIPADTEIRFIYFGGEEEGSRGSRCYVKRPLDELKRLDARLLNIETTASPEILTIEPLSNVLELTFEWIKNDEGKSI